MNNNYLYIKIYADVNKIASSTIVNVAWKNYIRLIIEGAIGFMGNAVTSRRIPLSSPIDPYTRNYLRGGDYSGASLDFPRM